jgi:hypothetical protein
MLFLQNVTFPPSEITISDSHFFLLNKMHMIGCYVISCPFSSHQASYNFLLCSPIPIGPYGPKTLVVHLQVFELLSQIV